MAPHRNGSLRATLDAAPNCACVGAFVPLACHDPDRRRATLRSAEDDGGLLEDIGADNFVTAAS